jgi:D-alanyl-D-alanine carboxypeptidase/D-alanyl-D-alanine-endopeptidase (penicillin-binding protein 4)
MQFRYWLAAVTLIGSIIISPVVQADEIASSAYFVEDLDTHKIIAQKQADYYFPPESTLKTYTAAAALMVLGPDFTYNTHLFFDLKAVRQQTLNGDVTLEFSGDPLLTQKDLAGLLESLEDHHIHEIKGNIVLVTKAFDHEQYSNGLAWDHRHICYSGAINSLNLDRNCFLFYVFPTQEGRAADISNSVLCSQHPAGEPCVINHVTTSSDKNCAMTLDQHNNQYTLSGCIAPHTKSQRMTLTIPNTTAYAEVVIKRQLKKMSIVLDGQVIESQQSPTSIPMATHKSHSLHSLVSIMLKNSDNLIANCLFKTTGAHYYHAQGSWMRGINAETEIFSKALNLDPKTLFIFDGSGLSYYNAVTPRQEVALLKYIHKTPLLANHIVSGLPVSATDGTLSNRLSAYPSYVHAKTGSRRDVSSLAGYVMRYNSRWLFSAFSVGMTPVPHGNSKQVDEWLLTVLPPLKQPAVKKNKVI